MIDASFTIQRHGFLLDVQAQIPTQGITAVFGPSGCGKTTLLRAIAGLDQHAGGRLTINGDVWQDEQTFLPTHQRPVGFVFQEASLFSHLDVRGNIEYGFKRIAPEQRNVSLERLITLLDLDKLLTRKPDTLSGGERQRVAIARALAVSPQLLLMDEPLASLDQQRKQEILPCLDALQHELSIPVIYVSHSTDEVAQVADHMLMLANGRIQASGDVHELLTRLDLPLAHAQDAEALIDAVVAEHDEQFNLTYVDFPGGRFSVPYKPLSIGVNVRVRVAARDVSLTLQHQRDTSILNIFAAEVETISDEGGAQVTVRLLVGGVPMLARITRKSASVLNITPGKAVFAQAKSVALLHGI